MKQANDNNFESLIEKDKLTLIDFYATWCMPCKMQAEVIDKMDKSRIENVDIIKVNVDEAPNLANAFEISSIPTLVIMKNGNIIRKNVGFLEQESLLKLLSECE